MPRPLTDAQRAHLAGGRVGHVILAEADLTTGFVRLSTLNNRVKWRGQTWLGSGDLISIDVVSSTAELAAQSFRVGFSYLNADMFDPSTLHRDTFLGRPIRLWYCPFDTASENVIDPTLDDDPRFIGDPLQFVEGTLDEDELEDNPEAGSGNLRFRVVNHLDVLTRENNLLYTAEHQKYLYGEDDLGLDNIAAIQDYDFKWGNPTAQWEL